MSIGIYSITSPSGRTYIGQSINIEKRWKWYKNHSKMQPRIHRSFLKHGFDSHEFRIVEECCMVFLNERERFWQEYYDCMNTGLNCRLTKTTDKSGVLSEEHKSKISIAHIGKKKSQESIDKMKVSKIGVKLS